MVKRLLVVIVLLLCTVPARAAEVRISAAASMTDAINAVCAAYRAGHPQVRFANNFAASGTLARQIAAGAPVDLFISANPKWMAYLVRQKIVPAAAVQTFAFNTLVFVGAPGRPVRTMQDLTALGRIAIGSPASVPAGQYARQALTHAGLYAKLLKANKLVMAKDVRQALVYADRAEVDGAFVYRTDALLAKQATIQFTVPQKLYPRVRYPLALTADGAKNPAAKVFFAYLRGAKAGKILEKYGFQLP
jgi:molybdate transport system substrate-binding protein